MIRILHVDDDPMVLDLVQTVLEDNFEAFTVLSEASPADGLARLHDSDVDCIVSDYAMEPTDGVDFLLAARERDPTIPFIILSVLDSREIATTVLAHGATDYVQKQFREDCYHLLANRIENAVSNRRVTRNQRRNRPRLSDTLDRTTDAPLSH